MSLSRASSVGKNVTLKKKKKTPCYRHRRRYVHDAVRGRAREWCGARVSAVVLFECTGVGWGGVDGFSALRARAREW